MCDLIARLRRELLAPGRRDCARRLAPGHARRRPTLAVAFPAVVAAVFVAVGVISGSGAAAVNLRSERSAVRVDRTCSGQPVERRVLDRTGKPARALLNELAILRTPQHVHIGLSDTQLGAYSGYNAVRIYERYVRVVPAPKQTRIVLVPALVCTASSGTRPTLAPQQVLLIQFLGPEFANDAKQPPSGLVGTAQQIAQGTVFPGLDADNRAWMQAVVVPDGVARVKLHFTPPFRPAYTRILTVHDNVAAAFPLPAYTPTTAVWFNAAGRPIHRYVDHRALKLDNCLRHHRTNCP